jgi:hypothetical protein
VRNIYEVLREKEEAVAQVRREIETLRSATPWLASEKNTRLDIFERRAECLEVMREAVGRTGDGLGPPVTPAVDEMEEALDKIRTRLVEAADNESKLRGPKKISHHLRHMAASLLGTTLH